MPFAGRFIIHWEISKKLGRRVGVSNIIPASGMAEPRSEKEAGGPSWRSGGQQPAAGCRMPAGGGARGAEHTGPHAVRSH